MITLLKQDSFSKALMLVGLSTDTKPTETFTYRGAELPIINGSTFYEIDEATYYAFDSENGEWSEQSSGGGGGYPEPTGAIQITQNGSGIDVKDYASADVDVPNTYSNSDEGKVVDNHALVQQTAKNISSNGTHDTTKNNTAIVNVPNTYAFEDEGKVVENGALVNQSFRFITANGNYDTTKDYTVNVNVPNSYAAGDEGKVVDNGALVSQTSKNINANGTIDTTKNNEVVVSVPNTYVAGDEGKVVSNGSLTSQSQRSITSNGTVDTTLNNECVVAVENSYSVGDEGKVVENGALVSQTSLSVSSDGTYDTTKNNEVVVNVSGGASNEAGFIQGTLSGAYENSDVSGSKGVRSYGLYGFLGLTSISLPNCKSVGDFGIAACPYLEYLNLPEVIEVYTSSLYMLGRSTTNGVSFNLPKLSRIGQYAFKQSYLKSIVLPSCNFIQYGGFQQLYGNDIEVDLSCQTHPQSGENYISSACFASSSIKSLILRSLDNIWPLATADALSNTPIASGTGYIYVPQALKSTYEQASNWVTYASQFRALENYTVDGTTTGALDPSKI